MPLKADDGNSQHAKCESEDEMADSDWEDGSNHILNSENHHSGIINKDITIEFDSSPGTAKRKTVQRASAEEKKPFLDYISFSEDAISVFSAAHHLEHYLIRASNSIDEENGVGSLSIQDFYLYQISHPYSSGLNGSSHLGVAVDYDAFNLLDGMSPNNQAMDLDSSDFDICFSRNGSPRGRWCKIKVAMRWVTVWKDINRRMSEFDPFSSYSP